MTTGPVHLRFAQPETLPGTSLDRDRVVPAAALRDANGDEVRPTVFRQHRPLVLAFLHDECAACAQFAADAAARQRDFAAIGAEIRAVLATDADSPLPAWIDRDGRGRETMLGEQGTVPTIVLLDRYAAAQASYPAGDHGFPTVDELVSELDWLAVQCPECST